MAGATVFLTHPNGDLLTPMRTSAAGLVNLTQVPAGSWPTRIAWRGIDVFSGTLSLAEGATRVTAAMYRLTVTVQDGNGAGLPGAFVSASDDSGLVFDASLADASGQVVLRLPAGNYTVRAAYRTSYLGASFSDEREAAVAVDASKSVSMSFPGLPIALTSTPVFQLSVLLALLAITSLTIIFRLWRKVKRLESREKPTYKQKGDG